MALPCTVPRSLINLNPVKNRRLTDTTTVFSSSTISVQRFRIALSRERFVLTKRIISYIICRYSGTSEFLGSRVFWYDTFCSKQRRIVFFGMHYRDWFNGQHSNRQDRWGACEAPTGNGGNTADSDIDCCTRMSLK